MTFLLLASYLIICLIKKKYINIIYFVMTYFIIRDALILIYFIICIGKPNKTNGQTVIVAVKELRLFVGRREYVEFTGSCQSVPLPCIYGINVSM